MASFHSILFPPGEDRSTDRSAVAPYLRDLNLDQIIESITTPWKEYDLEPFFTQPLEESDAVSFRQEVMRDLEQPSVSEAIGAFALNLRRRRHDVARSEKSTHAVEKQRWFLNGAVVYCDAIEAFATGLTRLTPASRGLRAWSEYLSAYVQSERYVGLATAARTLSADLDAVRYSLFIRANAVTVRPDENAPDYTSVVEHTFAKFRQEPARDYRVSFPDYAGLNHVEAQVLDRVALINPVVFGRLSTFSTQYASYLDPVAARFDREIHFYVAYLTHIDRLRRSGLPFCYPQVLSQSKAVNATDAFDLALAAKLTEDRKHVVQNNFFLQNDERILIVSGPNQGGKTTFARVFGQMHFLGNLGCPVPGTSATLFLYDQIFTHFEREEQIDTLRGKLQDDLMRVHDILLHATSKSLVIMNEVFSSTTTQDALFLSRQILARLSERDVLCVWVTFLAELASLDRKTVSMVSAVDPVDPTVRTFRLERRPPDGLAYAVAIAEKYHLTSSWLQKRLPA